MFHRNERNVIKKTICKFSIIPIIDPLILKFSQTIGKKILHFHSLLFLRNLELRERSQGYKRNGFSFRTSCSLLWTISNSNKYTFLSALFPHVTKCSLTFILIYSVHSCCFLCFQCFNSLSIAFTPKPQCFSHLDKECQFFYISNAYCF